MSLLSDLVSVGLWGLAVDVWAPFPVPVNSLRRNELWLTMDPPHHPTPRRGPTTHALQLLGDRRRQAGRPPRTRLRHPHRRRPRRPVRPLPALTGLPAPWEAFWGRVHPRGRGPTPHPPQRPLRGAP